MFFATRADERYCLSDGSRDRLSSNAGREAEQCSHLKGDGNDSYEPDDRVLMERAGEVDDVDVLMGSRWTNAGFTGPASQKLQRHLQGSQQPTQPTRTLMEKM